MELKTFLTDHPRFAIAFSGGVDSSYLLYAAKTFGCDVKAYFVKTPFQPQFELDDAKRLAYMLSVPMHVEQVNVLEHTEVTDNPSDRCYYCKKVIFESIQKLASADGYDIVCDGTNASDDAGERAGMRALAELSVLSPLRECGMAKSEIRDLSREAGLDTHDKPSYACLATRIPTGTLINDELLKRVYESEMALHALGFSDFRVRLLGNAAKIQMPDDQLRAVFDKRKKIVDALSQHFEDVLIDLVPRKTEV